MSKRLHSTLAGASPKPIKGDFKLERVERRAKLDKTEDAEMHAAKVRDGWKCRWPGCEFEKKGFMVHACHLEHRGAGGDPTGERTQRRILITLCARHHTLWDDVAAIDIQPRTEAGFDGPADFYERGEGGRMEHVYAETVIGHSVAVGA